MGDAEPTPADVAARLERLAARRSATPRSSSAEGEVPHPREPLTSGDEVAPRRPKRRHAAPAARAIAAGVSTTAFFGGVAVLGAAPEPAWDPAAAPAPSTTAPSLAPPTTAPAPPPTVVVVERHRRVIYVNEQGAPAGAPAAPPAPAARPPASSPTASATPAPAPSPTAAPAPPPTAAPAPRPTTPPPTVPACSGSQC